nr:hypothetical protein [Kineosporia babensis]
MRLDDQQRRHAYALAGEAFSVPPGPPADVPDHIHDLIERLPDTVAVVHDAKYDVLAWNHLAAAVLGDFTALPTGERNLLRYYFLPEVRDRLNGANILHDNHFASHAAGRLRTTVARYPQDQATQHLIQDLRRRSPEFAQHWQAAEVVGVPNHLKTFVHPAVGRLELRCDVLAVPERDQHVVLYTAGPGTPELETLKLLGVIGTQRMDASDLG